MASAVFSLGKLVDDADEKFVSSKRLDDTELSPETPSFGFYRNNNKPMDEDFLFLKYPRQKMSVFDNGHLDDLAFDAAGSQTIQTCSKKAADQEGNATGNTEHKKERRYPISMASLELLRNYGSGVKKLDGDRIIEPRSECESDGSSGDERLSIERIVRLAGVKFVQGQSSTDDLVSALGPFGLAFSGLSDEEKQEVHLVELLLLCAEKVSHQQYDRARNLLNQCSYLFSNQGTPVQRLLHYFADALHERIDRVTGRVAPEDFWKSLELNRDLLILNPTRSRIACHQEIPFSQVTQFTGLQAIIEAVADAKRVHVVDLCVGCGSHWAILMQAIQNSELELLRLTAIGTHGQHLVEDTSRRLKDFAAAMNIPFTFKLVMADDLMDLTEDHFEVGSEETVIVYSQYYLRTLIARPSQLDALMKVIVKISPSIMVVTETEANHNSPRFVDRFTEALFFYGAYFDCLETYMKRLDPNRLALESFYFGEGIRNTVAAEGDERIVRNVKIDVWRAFFVRFGMVEAELSPSSLYQASLVTKRFSSGKFCTLDMNGKCLLIGWKNTPLHSLSVWKFGRT